MVLKTPPNVLYKGLKEAVGSPEDYFRNKSKNYFPDYDTRIPLPQTKGSSEDDDIQAALQSMRISEMDDVFEEQKGAFRNANQFRDEPTPNNKVAPVRSDADLYMPVKALNQFSADWRIKVRVTKKYEVKKWNNARGNGELFTVDLVDADGTQIQGTFFNQQVPKFYSAIRENKVYVVSLGSIKLANKKFTSIPNDYCINFFDETEFVEVAEDSAISQDAWAFKQIKALEELQVQSAVDVIGIVIEVGQIGSIKLK